MRNGVVDLFGDRSSFFYIGSADVNISQEEAVRIAWEEAKNCTTVRIWMGDSYETFPFHLVEEHRTVQLYVGSTKDFGLYTYWKVWFAADPEVYSTTGFEVSLRADTGEISYSQLTGYMGSFNGAEAPDSEASSETQREGNLNPPLAAYVFAATASIITIIAIIMLAFKKEEKSPPAPLPQNM